LTPHASAPAAPHPILIFFLLPPPHPRSTLFPYTTLFRSLAVTLAERMDSGMIRRIQQFTTQNIPVATVAGLEPKIAAPKMFAARDRKSTRLNSSHLGISYAVFCLKKKKNKKDINNNDCSE